MIPAWKQRLHETLAEHAADRGVDGSVPRVRQVVHRGFMEEERGVPNERTAFLTTTDVRSPKAAEIHARPNVEVDWYIHPAKVQFRIAAQAYMVPGAQHSWRASLPGRLAPGRGWDAERRRVWDALSPPMQASFRGPPPGTPLADATHVDELTDDAAGIPSSFALIVLDPTAVDVLDLDQRKRVVYKHESDSWSATQVAP
ncbi:pyridoxal 5'-phosphate synthase [Malassezia japonica]|uniref:Pyridoxal 5'-phosphate synthase n=1 Tax=Malassezia japonica TaxID=223818 RepID=A0AAF0F420_9BASI|nr:pyridoxal 5'-phosphate synthase [Malassezia japonica]WFD40445.1 pyridoxal 5'-phosphate synthase [Malassezia japonica]